MVVMDWKRQHRVYKMPSHIIIQFLKIILHWNSKQKHTLFFKKMFIGVELIYNVVLVSAVQQSEPVIHTHISLSFRFFSHIGHYKVLSRVPCVMSRFLLVIIFVHSSMYMSISISQFIPPPLSPLVTISLFSTPVTLFLFCKGSFVPVFQILHISDII